MHADRQEEKRQIMRATIKKEKETNLCGTRTAGV